jgi:uncharacterized protein Veg
MPKVPGAGILSEIRAFAGAEMGLFSNRVKPFLPDRDYLALALPTSDMDLLWVLTREGGNVRRFGALADVLTAPTAPGEELVRRDAVVVDMTGEANRSAKLGLTLSVVNTIITALGGTAGLSLSGTGASKVIYTYTDVVADAVNIAKLDGWLNGADLSQTAPRIADLLVAEKIYVVLGALKASGITVSLLDNADHEVSVDVPTIQQLVGANVTVDAASGRSNTITFHGGQALTVAAKVAQLKVDERGFWVSEKPLSDGEIRDLGADSPDYLGGDELYLD